MDEMFRVECGNEFYQCRCYQEADHSGNHLCECGGEWSPVGEVVAFPSPEYIGPVQPRPVEYV